MIGRVCGLAMHKSIGIRYCMHVYTYTYIKLCLVKDTEISYT